MRKPGTQKLASLTLAYNQEDYLEPCLRHLAPRVGAMFVMYSELPFTRYNPDARTEYCRLDGTKEILRRLGRELPNLRIIEGEWECEEDMRNSGLSAALQSGFEVLLVVDADEFYMAHDLLALQDEVLHPTETDSWWCQMRVPFKHCDYVIDREDEFLPVALRLDSQVCFTNRRIPNGKRRKLENVGTCFNMGFVLSDERMLEKTRTWSHAHQLPKGWYQEKWLNWTPATKNLHTRQPNLWPRTRKHPISDYPEALHAHPLLRVIPSEP